MENAVNFVNFLDSPVLNEYCTYIAVTVMRYQSNIRKTCNDMLTELNDNTKKSKFMTKHIVIAKIIRLRFELQSKKTKDSKNFQFFDGIGSDLIEKFWEHNI